MHNIVSQQIYVFSLLAEKPITLQHRTENEGQFLKQTKHSLFLNICLTRISGFFLMLLMHARHISQRRDHL